MKVTTQRQARTPRLGAYLLLNESKYQRGQLVPQGETKRGLKTKQHRHAVDLDQLNALARIGCTIPEMAMVLGVSEEWINLQRNSNPAVELALTIGDGDLKSSLRRAQIDLAMSGNSTMLVWLGKQYLGQSDKQQVASTSEVNITVERAKEELRALPRDVLLNAQAVIDGSYKEGAPVEDAPLETI